MKRETFERYLETYNSGDMEAVRPFYADDIVFENFGGHHEGADVLTFLEELHSGITDTMTIRALLVDGDEIALDCDTDIVAKIDLPDLPAGPMEEGEHAVMRTFVFYRTEGKKIKHIRIAGWPPQRVD